MNVLWYTTTHHHGINMSFHASCLSVAQNVSLSVECKGCDYCGWNDEHNAVQSQCSVPSMVPTESEYYKYRGYCSDSGTTPVYVCQEGYYYVEQDPVTQVPSCIGKTLDHRGKWINCIIIPGFFIIHLKGVSHTTLALLSRGPGRYILAKDVVLFLFL